MQELCSFTLPSASMGVRDRHVKIAQALFTARSHSLLGDTGVVFIHVAISFNGRARSSWKHCATVY
jgi:hypothetical protein